MNKKIFYGVMSGWMLLSSGAALARDVIRTSDGEPVRWRGHEPYETPVVADYSEVWPSAGFAGIAGAILSGPAGAIIGITGGALLGHQVDTIAELEKSQTRLFSVEKELVEVINALKQSDQKSASLQQALATTEVKLKQQLNQLAVSFFINISFRSESALIENRYERQLQKVVKLLAQIPALEIHINAHTDARGTKSYNQQLAENRALIVSDFFLSRGVHGNRIKTDAHGESKAEYQASDSDGTGFDRHVLITFCLKEIS